MQIYTTEELIKILEQERAACMKGQRLSLATPIFGDPAIDVLLQSDGFQKFRAFQDFKDAIHEYQRRHQVSGLVWREIEWQGNSLRYPTIHEHLTSISSDLLPLWTAKAGVMEFWQAATQGLDLYLSVNHGKAHRPIASQEWQDIMERSQWLNLWKWERGDFLEWVLQLGWGKPEEAVYSRGLPDSGSEFVHAVKPGYQPIG